MSWTLLGLAPDADEHAIKHAYAQRLREIGGPEGDPKAFQKLREAYEACLLEAKKHTEAELFRKFLDSLFGFGGFGGYR